MVRLANRMLDHLAFELNLVQIGQCKLVTECQHALRNAKRKRLTDGTFQRALVDNVKGGNVAHVARVDDENLRMRLDQTQQLGFCNALRCSDVIQITRAISALEQVFNYFFHLSNTFKGVCESVHVPVDVPNDAPLPLKGDAHRIIRRKRNASETVSGFLANMYLERNRSAEANDVADAQSRNGSSQKETHKLAHFALVGTGILVHTLDFGEYGAVRTMMHHRRYPLDKLGEPRVTHAHVVHKRIVVGDTMLCQFGDDCGVHVFPAKRHPRQASLQTLFQSHALVLQDFDAQLRWQGTRKVTTANVVQLVDETRDMVRPRHLKRRVPQIVDQSAKLSNQLIFFHCSEVKMDATARKRAFLFWTFCIPLRAFVVSLAIVARINAYEGVELLVAVYASYVAIGLLRKFLEKALEPCLVSRYPSIVERNRYGNFGGVVWWQYHRLVHVALLTTYALLVFRNNAQIAYYFLIADLVYACAAGASHYVRCTITNEQIHVSC